MQEPFGVRAAPGCGCGKCSVILLAQGDLVCHDTASSSDESSFCSSIASRRVPCLNALTRCYGGRSGSHYAVLCKKTSDSNVSHWWQASLLMFIVLFHPGGDRVIQRLQGALEGGIHHAPFPDHSSAVQGPDEGALSVVVADFDPAIRLDPRRSEPNRRCLGSRRVKRSTGVYCAWRFSRARNSSTRPGLDRAGMCSALTRAL